VVTVRLYVEGGGDSKELKTHCRRGFRKFIEKAGLQGRMPRIVACGGRQRAYDSFATALAAGTSPRSIRPTSRDQHRTPRRFLDTLRAGSPG